MHHTPQEQQAIAADIARDIDGLDSELALSTLKKCKLWNFLCDQVIDWAIQDRTVVFERDVETERLEWEGKLSSTLNDLEKAQGKIDDLREKLGYHSGDLDRLQEMIAARNVADALDLLRDMYPEHQFLSPAAEHMLAGIRGQGALTFPAEGGKADRPSGLVARPAGAPRDSAESSVRQNP
ncbi:hypothetical protein [Mesorhizobium sp. B1-1-7]|uniref:hypothetical protein n=1 Tax=Mesorhizobium sp. B1-1-7 TaxID=2589977 RepID=UPI00112B9B96|nr:hypothetical protein [Mesorhizobium sp. B1-1-7]TPN44901.1 hypothetical protein FJ978_28385 [Mesorhizobium sp. B1-1-7]